MVQYNALCAISAHAGLIRMPKCRFACCWRACSRLAAAPRINCDVRRFTLRTPIHLLAEQFAAILDATLEPQFNIGPSQLVAVVRAAGDRTPSGIWRRRWGLVPSWARRPRQSVDQRVRDGCRNRFRPSGGGTLRHRRVFEWQRAEARASSPLHQMADEPPAFAIGKRGGAGRLRRSYRS